MAYVQHELIGKKKRQDGPILLIEDSRTFASILTYRFQREVGPEIVHCANMDAVRAALESRQDYPIAVVDLNLPGSPYGEVVDLTIACNIPTIVFTGTFDLSVRERILKRYVVDYVIKDNERACDTIVESVKRGLSNRDVRVLVVDEDAETRARLVELLRAQLFIVSEAASGTSALLLMEQFQDIELVVSGHILPDMDGTQLVRRIRRKFGSDRMRVIGVLPTDDRLSSVGFIKAGASDIVYLPLLAEEVQCRVNHNIDTLNQIKQLRQAASSDYLTGLFNRRHFYNHGSALVEKSLVEKRPCALAIIDIDHFRRLNEIHGHDFGDSVLMGLAARLTELVEGQGHLVCRLGGEEFGMIMVDMDGAAAASFCDMIRRELGAVRFVVGDEEISATVSIGIAEVQAREIFINYVNAADQFLFMAKQSGRDRVFSDYLMEVSMQEQAALVEPRRRASA